MEHLSNQLLSLNLHVLFFFLLWLTSGSCCSLDNRFLQLHMEEKTIESNTGSYFHSTCLWTCPFLKHIYRKVLKVRQSMDDAHPTCNTVEPECVMKCKILN